MPGRRVLFACLLVHSLSACRREDSSAEDSSAEDSSAEDSSGGTPPPRELPQTSPSIRCQKPELLRSYGLPFQVAGTCVDASVDVRQYGAGAAQGLDAICTEFFQSECELYRSFGLLTVSTFEYADRSGASRLLVRVSEFEKTKGAFAFYLRRSVGDSTPREVPVRALSLDAWAALGSRKLYLNKGRLVLEVSYLNELEAALEQAENAERLLSAFVEGLAIGAELKRPKEAELLVRLGVVPFDLRVVEDEILGVSGFGQHYLGFVERKGRSYLVHLSDQGDEDRAKDALLRLKAQRFGKDQREKTILRVRQTEEGKDPLTAFFTRRGAFLLGVKPLAGSAHFTPDDESALLVLDDLLKRWKSPI